MRKKDYELIEWAILNKMSLVRRVEYSAEDALTLLALDLGVRLGSRDPKFNRDNFLTACGIKTKVGSK